MGFLLFHIKTFVSNVFIVNPSTSSRDHPFIDVDLEGQDIYKRHLGRIYVDGEDINKKMVSTGSAWVYDKYVTEESFYIEQKKAQNDKLGIWANEEAVPPWVWRQRKN